MTDDRAAHRLAAAKYAASDRGKAKRKQRTERDRRKSAGRGFSYLVSDDTPVTLSTIIETTSDE